MQISVNINDNGVSAALAGLAGRLADRTGLHQRMGNAVEASVIAHLLGLPGERFYGQAAESTQVEASDGEAVVSIRKRGMALRYYGGVVRPSGKTSEVTGKPIRSLSVPVVKGLPPIAEYGSPLAFIPRRGGGATVGYLVEGERYTVARGKRKGQQAVRPVGNGSLMYVLRRQTTHEPDAKVLPTMEALTTAARMAAEAYLGKGLMEDMT